MKMFVDTQIKHTPSSIKPRRVSRAINPLVTSAVIAFLGCLASIACALPSFAQILGTSQLNTARRGHTATLLQNGKVLIVGGDNQSGIIGQTEIYDPATTNFAAGPSLQTARTDHAAIALPDGRVLVIGGRDQNGPLTSSEIYNPLTGSFTSGSSMTTPRSGHTVTALSNGSILVAGGDAAGSAEIYQAATQTFSPVAANMMIARKLHSAILTSAGQVLIVGGVNAQNAVLNTAEVYDPASQSFYLSPTDMQMPRAFATLRLLPDSKVQIIGGDSDFSMEIFDPQDGRFNGLAYLPPTPDLLGATLSTRSRAALVSPYASLNPNLLGTALTPEQLALLDRADHTITELTSKNQALVAGGISSGGQVLNSASLVASSPASVTTDKTDYAPGTIVTITGTGFQPNEDVAMALHERPDAYPDFAFTANADNQGNFTFMQFAPQSIDVGRTFTLTAIGQSSGFTAQTAFKDANAKLTVTVTGNGKVDSSPSGIDNCRSGSPAANCFENYNITTPAQNVTLTPTADSGSVFVGWGGDCSGAGSCTVAMSTDKTVTATFTTSVATTLTLSAPAPASVPFGSSGPVTLSATLTRTTGGAPVIGATINFTVDASSVGSAVTNGSGVASITTNPSLLTVGNHSIEAASAQQTISSTTYAASTSGTQTLTVNKRAITVTADAKTKIYGDADPTLTYQLTSGSLASGDSFTGVLTRDAGETVGSYAIKQGTLTVTNIGNYDLTYVEANLTINKRNATWTTNEASKTYGDADPIPLTTGSGIGFIDAVTATYSRVAGESVAGSPYHITAALSAAAGVLDNYNITNNGADFTINKRNATWTTNAASKTYGDADPIPLTTGSGSDFLAADGVSATYSRAAGENASPPIYHITATLSATVAGALNNYNITNAGAEFTINKRNAIWTTNPASKIYGDSDPSPLTTGSGSNFVAADNVTATYSRVAGENASPPTYHITATLSATVSGALNNYIITDNGAEFTINKKNASVTAVDNSKIYGDADPTLTTTNSGFLAADLGATKISFSASRVAGENASPPTYTITPSASDNGTGLLNNYNVAFNNGTFTINKRNATWTTNPNSKTYGDADPSPLTTGSGTNFVASDGVSATYSRAAGENASPPTYHITATLSATVSGALNNYIITNNGAEFTINKRAITVTADAKSKIYNDADPALTYQVTSGSLAFSDAFAGALSRAAGEVIGTYAILQNTLSISNINNYSLTYVGANLTITTGFAFNGFYSPIGGSVENGNGGSYSNPIKAFKLGSTIPVKFGATWLNGGGALITGIHTLQAAKYSSAIDSDPPIDATPTDAATDGNQFRLTDGEWHFNFSTKAGFTAGTWLLRATLVDGSQHTVWITIKK